MPEVIRDRRHLGFAMFSFQPAAFVGDSRRWRESYRAITDNDARAAIEAGAGAGLPWQAIRIGDFRCNRAAFGLQADERSVPPAFGGDPAMALPAQVELFTQVGPWTEEDFFALPEDRRIELLDGELLVSPSARTPHQRLSRHLANALDAAAHEGFEVLEAINVRVAPGRILIPDVAVITTPGIDTLTSDFAYGLRGEGYAAEARARPGEVLRLTEPFVFEADLAALGRRAR